MLHVNDFQAINGRFSNKASLQCKEALFALKRSLLLRTKKSCLKTGGISLVSVYDRFGFYIILLSGKNFRLRVPRSGTSMRNPLQAAKRRSCGW